MINNRQGGRRRGRGGQRPQGMPGNTGGNARDNRQRGNAAQLLEKYKSMARDAQLVGDRVQAEYFLQFADHYFRVLEEGRSRFEDGQQQQRRRGGDDDYDNEDAELIAESDDDGDDPGGEQPAPRDARDTRPRARQRDRANGRPREPEQAGGDSEEERISIGVLPPAIGGDEDERPRRARRAVRRPRNDEQGEDVAV